MVVIQCNESTHFETVSRVVVYSVRIGPPQPNFVQVFRETGKQESRRRPITQEVAGSPRRKKVGRGFRGTWQKLSTCGIEKIYEESWSLGPVDLYPSVREGCRMEWEFKSSPGAPHRITMRRIIPLLRVLFGQSEDA